MQNNEKLKEALLELHKIIEEEAQELRYGAITFNVFLKDCKPLIETLNIVKQKPKKYQLRRGVSVCQSTRLGRQSVILPV